MRGSIKLFDAFGIAIKIHITFLLLPFLGYLYTAAEYGVLQGIRIVFLIFSLFFFVVCHELSHSLQAKKYGVVVRDITLLPIGGIAAMESIPDNPKQELAISIAGPLFNFILAAVFFLPAKYLLGGEVLFPAFHLSLESWAQTLASLYWVNLVLGIFNLLPAFPMDGGRIFRAFLAQRIDYRKATRIAVGFGHTFAVLFAFVGIILPNYLLVIIAFFIYVAASQEELQVDIRMILKNFRVKDLLSPEYLSVTPDATLSKVLELMFHSHVEDFPVVEGDRLVGLLTRADITRAVHQYGMGKSVKEAMRREFPTAKASDPLTSVHKKMQESGIKAVPILKDDRLCGIITVEDISKVYTIMSARK